jgi:hypothetical protein
MAFVTQNMRASMAGPQAASTPPSPGHRPLPFSVLLVSSAALAVAFTWLVSGSVTAPPRRAHAAPAAAATAQMP